MTGSWGRSLTAGIVAVAALALTQPIPAVAASVPGFSDNFDGTVSEAPGYGLNDNLTEREAGDGSGPTGLITYTRVSGVWYAAPPPAATYSTVTGGALAFTSGTSAVRVDAPTTLTGGTMTATATLTPTVGSTSSQDWSSLVMTGSSTSAGYVAETDTTAALLIRANGQIQVFQAGNVVWSGSVTAAPSYQVGLALAASSLTLTVNGVAHQVPLPTAVPTANWVYLGRYSDATTTTSTVDNLTVSAIDNSALRPPATSNVRYIGYYPARITAAAGDHVSEVAGRSNLNWIQISDVTGVATSVLAGCRPHSCVVYTGNEFFDGCDGTDSCTLDPNAAARWQGLANAIAPYANNIAAFYLLDEAYYRGASYADVSTSAQLIKKTYPNTPVILSFAAPTLDGSFQVPDAVDWVAFDQYCTAMSAVTDHLHALEAGAPGKDVLLFVQSAPLSACPAAANTDAAIGEAQHAYLGLAESDPHVIGLFEFGLWAPGVYPTVQTPADLPATTDTEERIAAQLGS